MDEKYQKRRPELKVIFSDGANARTNPSSDTTIITKDYSIIQSWTTPKIEINTLDDLAYNEFNTLYLLFDNLARTIRGKLTLQSNNYNTIPRSYDRTHSQSMTYHKMMIADMNSLGTVNAKLVNDNPASLYAPSLNITINGANHMRCDQSICNNQYPLGLYGLIAQKLKIVTAIELAQHNPPGYSYQKDDNGLIRLLDEEGQFYLNKKTP